MIKPELLKDYDNPLGKIQIGVSGSSGVQTNNLIGGVILALENCSQNYSEITKEIKFIWRNDGRSITKANRTAQEYSEANIDYVIGHFSSTSALSAAKVYSQKNILFLAPGSSHPDLSKYDNTLTFCSDDTSQAAMIVNFAQNFQNVFILKEDIEYGNSLVKELEIAFKRMKHIKITLSSSILEAYRTSESQIDLIIICGRQEFAISSVQEISRIKESEHTHIFLSDDSYSHLFFSKVEMVSRKISIATMSPLDKYSIICGDLVRRYRNLMKELPGAYFFNSYIAFEILIKTLYSCNFKDNKIVEKFIKNYTWSTVFGDISFNPFGNIEGLRWSYKNLEYEKNVHSKFKIN